MDETSCWSKCKAQDQVGCFWNQSLSRRDVGLQAPPTFALFVLVKEAGLKTCTILWGGCSCSDVTFRLVMVNEKTASYWVVLTHG